MKQRNCTRIADEKSAPAVFVDRGSGPMPGMEPGCELLAVLRPYVRHCGDRRRPAWRIGPRRLLDYLLVYIAEGRGRFSLEDSAWEVGEGDLFWVPPDTLHEMEGFAPGMLCPYVHFDLLYRPSHSHWDFSIPGGMTDLSELQPLLHPPLGIPRLDALAGRIAGHTNRRVGQLIQEVCAEAARAQPYAALRLSGLMMEVVAEILRGTEGLAVEHMGHIPSLERAAEVLVRDCAAPPSLEVLARQSQLSPGHFRLLFQRHFACPPRSYLRRARLRKARDLMVASSLTLSEIAGIVGFGTVHSLSRAFRAEEGLSPTEYRRCFPVRTRVEGRATPYVL